MITLFRIFKWVLRAWPFLCIFALGYAHYAIVFYLGLDVKKVHDIIALASQIFGGLLVLYSIDSTIGIMNGTSLIEDLVAYLKEFPLVKRNTVVQIGAAAELNITSKVAAISAGMPQSIEEQILYLQNQIDALRNETTKSIKEIESTINTKANQLHVRIDNTEKSVRNFEKKVSDISLGGVKIQILGVMLLIYGAITSYIA